MKWKMKMNDDEMMFQEETNYSTRDQNGQIVYFETIEEAIKSFVSYDGYRLSIVTDEFSLYIFRDELPELTDYQPGSIGYSNPAITYKSTISYFPRKEN